MIKIGVFGHSPDEFSYIESLTTDIDNIIAVIKRQHEFEKDFIFLLNCEPGISQTFCDILISQRLPYEVYLPFTPNESNKYWTEPQQEKFIQQLNNAHAVHVCGMDNSIQSCIERNKKVVDDSQWVIVFWNGKHQGFTYTAMQYALNTNKITYNGIGGINIVDKSVFNIGEK